MIDSDKKLGEILEQYSHIWKTKAAFMSYLRGGFRKGVWMKHPVKLEFIKNNRQRIPNPNPRGRVDTVWGGQCGVCKELFPQLKLQVDHIRDYSASLRDIKDIQSFVETISIIVEEDLQFICKECHDATSYSQKHGCSFQEAVVRKKHIVFVKENTVEDELKRRGIEVPPKTKAAKNELLLSMLLNELKSEETK